MNEEVDCLNNKLPMNVLYNNSTINININSDKSNVVKINCPKLGSGDVHHNTNSPFCKDHSCVNYNWQDISGINWLSIHRTQPIIAYVINPSYRKSLVSKSYSFTFSDQIIRLLNYEENILGKCSGTFNKTIADLCFSYNCLSQKETLLAAVDLKSNINIFVFKEIYENGKKSFDFKLILEIKSEYEFIYESVILNWCPFVGFEEDDETDEENDPGMKLAVASNNSIEIFSVNKLISYNSEFKRSELDVEEHDYKILTNKSTDTIVKISLSSESSAVCTASKDKNVKFYHIESEFKELHNWEPELAPDSKLSYFHFLDDYNRLLENKKHEFWGFAFLGTEQGEISVWDLRKWKVIQRLKLICNILKDEVFTYKADITSHIVIAIKKNDIFVIQLNFNKEIDNDTEISYPRITKISRFQIYNNILSFVCKRSNEKEIDLFLISPVSLQRTTIDVEQLIEEKSTEDHNSFNNSVNMNLNSLNSSFNLDNLIKNYSKEGEDLMKKIEISSLFPDKSKFSNISNSNISSSNISSSNISSKNINSSYKKLEPDKSTTPNSQEVENLFKDKGNRHEIDLNNILPPQLDKSENFHSFTNPYLSDSPSFVRKSELKKYVTKESIDKLCGKLDTLINFSLESKKDNENKDIYLRRLDTIEKKLHTEMNSCKNSLIDVTEKLSCDFKILQNEFKNPDQFKIVNKVLDNFLRKIMEQMNLTISKGLEEFISQIKSEVIEINNQLNKMKSLYESRYETTIKKYEKLSKNIITISDKMKEISDQQLQVNMEYKQNINNLQALSSVPPSPMIFNKSYIPSSISLIEEEKIQSKKERIKNIWSLIETNVDEKILQGFIDVLDLKDQPLTTKVLKHFMNDHMKLINIIKSDQTVLISLLHQLTFHELEKDLWKIKLIPDILSVLNLKSSFIRYNFNQFVNKLIKKLENIQNSNNSENSEYETTIRLTIFVLNCQKGKESFN